MLAQINTHKLVPILKRETIDLEAYSKEEVIELGIKLFGYGRHFGLTSETYNKGNLLIRKGVKQNSRWLKVELVDVEKVQKRRLETTLVFYAEKQFDEDWFVTYFHLGDWMQQLKSVVDEFEGQCFCSKY